MDKQEVAKKIRGMMKDSGAHLEGHFLLTSGNHSGDYIQCAMMLRFPNMRPLPGRPWLRG